MTRTGDRRPRWDIDDVLARTDLTALLDEVAEPATHTMRGRRWHCPMPDHDDHHASVTTHTDHRGHERWRCWSGDNTHRGDAIDLVAATQHLSPGDAINWLANRAGLHPDQTPPPVRKRPPPRPAIVPLDPAVTHYVHACERILWSLGGRPVLEWLHRRGFDNATIQANHLGADPGRTMLRRTRGLPRGTSVAATFPSLSPDGEVRYVQARYLNPGNGPKYDNPAAALGTNPRLAWTQTPHGPPTTGLLLICEGPPDALTAAQAGFRSVGILGSQAPDQRVAARLAAHADRNGDRLVAVIDADPAGRTAGDRLRSLATEHGQSLTIVEPPDGLDLNTWASQDQDWTRVLPRHATTEIEPPGRRSIHADLTASIPPC